MNFRGPTTERARSNFRLTDIYNHVVTESVMPAADKVVDGKKQSPLVRDSAISPAAVAPE